MHGGVYNYSPFLLRAAYLPIGPQDQMVGGIFLGLAFLAALSLLPPARSRSELLLRILATCSETVVFALERANFDVVIFLMTLLGVLLLLANRWMALLGYAVFLLGAALKFYPAALLALAIRERLSLALAVAVLIVSAGVSYAMFFAHGTEVAVGMLPTGLPLRGIFGAINLPFGLVLLRFFPVLTLEPNQSQYLAAIRHPHAVFFIYLTSKCLMIAAVMMAIVMAPRYETAFRDLDTQRSLFLMAGAILIVFCFFSAQNISYRGIFLILTLPGLWSMAAQSPGRDRRTFVMFSVSVLMLLWEDFFRELVAFVATSTLQPYARPILKLHSGCFQNAYGGSS